MLNRSTVRSLLIAMLVVGALGATGPPSTTGEFTDGHGGTGAFAVESNSGGGSFVAYHDRNGNGKHNKKEETFTATDLTELTRPNVDLRFYSGAGRVTNARTNVTTATIRRDTGTEIQTGPFRLVTDGVLDVSDFAINADSVEVRANGADATLSGVTIERANPVKIVATNGGQVVVPGLITTSTGDVNVTASGVDASDADLQGDDVYVSVDGAGAVFANTMIDSRDSVSIETEDGGQVDGNEMTVTATNELTVSTSGDLDLSGSTLNSSYLVKVTSQGGDVDLSDAHLHGDSSITIQVISGDVDLRGATCNVEPRVTVQNGQVYGECDTND